MATLIIMSCTSSNSTNPLIYYVMYHSISFYFVMQVSEVNGDDVTCVIKNSATLAGSLYTLHVSQIRIDLPTLTNKDKEVTIRNLCA